MDRDHPRDFACPRCQARYKTVRTMPEPGTPDRVLHCKVCQHPLASTEGEAILKYFLVSRPRRERQTS